MTEDSKTARKMGLLGATGVGVGAIVGGGILALAGAGFAATGPSVMVAFALNGVIALLTALSFAEGIIQVSTFRWNVYVCKKSSLNRVRLFCGLDCLVRFNCRGGFVCHRFAQFALLVVEQVWPEAPSWIFSQYAIWGCALAAITFYTVTLIISRGGSGVAINVLKITAFAVLIFAGFWVLSTKSDAPVATKLTPFFANGMTGLLQAMGFTFIALQGFDLIAAVAGDVQRAERNVPRAMFLSLAVALIIYLPLLFVVATVGTPAGTSITAASQENPESILAIAAQNYLGATGYWVVLVAGVLSMLSALGANMYAASQVAMAMARDRSLPSWMSRVVDNGNPGECHHGDSFVDMLAGFVVA